MRRVDVAILVLCGLAILFSATQKNSFTFKQVTTLETKQFRYLPRPVITDIDGDGNPDILFAGVGGVDKLLLMTHHASSTLRTITTGTVVGTPGVRPSSKIMKIHVAQVGLPTPSIVVLTDHLDLILFDHQLVPLWVTALPQKSTLDGHRETGVYEIGVVGGNIPIWKGDTGFIVVAIRLNPEGLESNKWKHESLFNISKKTQEQTAEEEHEDTNHVNYYAFESKTGVLRWTNKYHTGDPDLGLFGMGEVNQTRTLTKGGRTAMAEHSWKLHVIGKKHFEQFDWQEFYDSIMATLPHSWYHVDDTSLGLDHFKKEMHFVESLEEEVGWNSAAVGVPLQALPRVFRSPQTKKENKKQPNCIVAHTSLGVEVIHLYTGHPLTSLKLHNHALYADFDEDHTIDQIWTSVGHESEHHKPGESGHECSALFASGVPNARKLVNSISICSEDGWFSGAPKERKETDAVPPITISSKESHFFRVLEPGVKSTIFLALSGPGESTLTSVSGRSRSWQIVLPLGWDKADVLFKHVMPSIVPFRIESALENDEVDDSILAVSTKLVLVSSSGNILTELEISNLPTTYPIIGDINGDGINDVIVVTDSSYMVFILQGSGGGGIIPIVVGLLLLTIIGIHVRQYQQQQSERKNRK